MKFDPTQAECHVFTFKEGALSALAHDLELVVRSFSIDVGADLSIDARMDAGSLEVLHALKEGRAHALSESDRHKIERTIVEEVLVARRHPEIRYTAPPPIPEGDGFLLRGELSLAGRTRPVEVRTRKEGSRQLAEVLLSQPDFGITPYRAMLGALRIRPEVKVRVSLPWPLPSS